MADSFQQLFFKHRNEPTRHLNAIRYLNVP